RSNLERLMASAGLDAIIATDPATVAALAGYRSWLDGRFRQFMVSPRGSGDLIRTYAIFIAGDRPVAAIVDALFARDAASAGAECLAGLLHWFHSAGVNECDPFGSLPIDRSQRMAKLVFGMNQSLDGYVDHMAFAPSPRLFRHFIEQVRGLAGSVYGRRMYEVMRYWDEDRPEWSDAEREFALAWRSQPKWVVSHTLKSVGPN